MSEFNDIGSIASIIGMFIGFGAIVYAYYIKREVYNISNKQTENAQGPYKLNTSKNMDEIHRYVKEIIRITKNIDGDELEESVNHSNITAELNSYYQADEKKMKLLLEESVRELGAWSDLDQNVRLKLSDIINCFRWLVNDFFEINRDEEMQIRIWTENHEKLTTKKYTIERILKSNKEILS